MHRNCSLHIFILSVKRQAGVQITDTFHHSAFSLENLVELKALFNRFHYGRAFFRFLLQLDFSKTECKLNA